MIHCRNTCQFSWLSEYFMDLLSFMKQRSSWVKLPYLCALDSVCLYTNAVESTPFTRWCLFKIYCTWVCDHDNVCHRCAPNTSKPDSHICNPMPTPWPGLACSARYWHFKNGAVTVAHKTWNIAILINRRRRACLSQCHPEDAKED